MAGIFITRLNVIKTCHGSFELCLRHGPFELGLKVMNHMLFLTFNTTPLFRCASSKTMLTKWFKNRLSQYTLLFYCSVCLKTAALLPYFSFMEEVIPSLLLMRWYLLLILMMFPETVLVCWLTVKPSRNPIIPYK